MARVRSIDGLAPTPIDAGWTLVASAPGAWTTPADIDVNAERFPARVPGTVAGAMRDAGRLDIDAPEEFDDRDWWFTTTIEGHGHKLLSSDGIATSADVFLDDVLLFHSDDMYVANEVVVELSGAHRLSICCRALVPLFEQPLKRARWRPKLATPQTLRAVRATFLGRMNGWCPPVHAVGPWRPVTIHDATPRVLGVDLKARCDGASGILEVALTIEGLSDANATLRCGERQTILTREAGGQYVGSLTIENVRLWWPHTHGEPNLYDVSAQIGEHVFDLGRVGFRDVTIDRETDGEGFAIHVNGERIFCRGALWTTPDLVTLPDGRDACEPLLRMMVDAGMNMVRVGGTMVYESDAFYELCDDLGLLVWQDFMFSNFDYPAADESFRALVDREARQFLDRTQVSPSIILLCGASEVAQQAAMMGLPAPTWTNAIYEDLLREAARDLRPDTPYIAHTPFGGALPFEPARGVCHYYGVSAYMRPVEDARTSNVRFAAECLGFANVPDGPVEFEKDRAAIIQPCWGERYERDVGATWFFEDVRNHYLRELYGVDPEVVCKEDRERYLDLSRAINAELMEGVFALWRRVGSPTNGGLVWFLRDVVYGAGFGVIGDDSRPKSVYHALRRAFRATQVLLVDEGLNGVDVHLINERSRAIDATLSLACLRDGSTPVMRAERAVSLAPRSSSKIATTDLWGGFFDTGYAYRFGPPSHDVVVARLTDPAGAMIAEAIHFPLGRGAERHDLGLAARVERDGENWSLVLSTNRLAQSVHIVDDAHDASDNWFHLAPGHERRITMKARGLKSPPRGVIRAINSTETIPYGAPT
jgi:beta-mannosidase